MLKLMVGSARLAAHTAVLFVLLTGAAQALEWEVNALDDPGDGTCDATHCSLREALLSLGSNDSVVFDLSATGQTTFTIELGASLLIDASEVTVDGLDCTGCGTVAPNTNSVADGLNSALAIRLVPGGTYAGGPLLTIEGNDVTVVGLNLDAAPSSAIVVDGDRTTLRDLYIGTLIDGSAGTGNTGNRIETLVAPDLTVLSCLISGNAGHGISISDEDSDDPTVRRSVIGLSLDGSTLDGNAGHGIYLLGSGDKIRGPTFGGTLPADGNLISGNAADGIRIVDKVEGDNQAGGLSTGLIGNNIIGTNAAVTEARGNGGAGLRLQGSSGSDNEPQELWIVDNVLSGNTGPGIWLESCKESAFHGNAIGTDMAGLAQLGNGEAGIYAVGSELSGGKDTKLHAIGGVGVENTIAWNTGAGLLLYVPTNGSSGKVKEIAIRANVIHDNGGIGIDLQGFSGTVSAPDGVGPLNGQPTSCTDDNAWGNRAQPIPVISSASLVPGTLTVEGTSCADATVDVYLADADVSGYGEPMTFLGTSTANGSGDWSLVATVTGLANADLITAVQTDTGDDSSEAALNVPIDGPCDLDGDGVDNATGGLCIGLDCDDNDNTVYPLAPELCDGIDNDCDTLLPADEADADSDGEMACAGDCDDADPLTNTSATQICDGVDNDCSGSLPANEADDDSDGELVCQGDCDDTDATVNTAATELCDGLDTDCDGTVPPGDRRRHRRRDRVRGRLQRHRRRGEHLRDRVLQRHRRRLRHGH